MAAVTEVGARVRGRVVVPGDKSISHRALMFAALATGTSRIDGILDSADVRSTASVLRALGVDVPPLAATMSVTGVGFRGFRAPEVALDCGNSGTTTRLMAGIVAGLPFTSRFTGDESLSRRPMRRVAGPLETMGARITLNGDALPMQIEGGPLRPIRFMNTPASAQVKSAVLLAGLVAGVTVAVIEPEPSRDHTERFLLALGADLQVRDDIIVLRPPAALRAFALRVPGDPSSAAFFAAAAALAKGGELELPGVLASGTRDGFFRTLAEMGAVVGAEPPTVTDAGEMVTTYRVSPGSLRGVTVPKDRVPSMIDELPLLACVAAYAEGETVISGAAELRVKESDRIATTAHNLAKVGVTVEELPDGMRIVGRPGARLSGRVVTHGDHRIAMAFGVLGAMPGNAIEVDDPECVGVSYPGFWDDLARVAA
jgi:3-phosphoshikimate 1-carboxyvinyltransferase